MDKYFVITSGESGISIVECDKEQVRKYIEPDEDGCWYYGYQPTFLDKVPKIDKGFMQCKRNSMLIIKGKVIQPKEKKVITAYDIE